MGAMRATHAAAHQRLRLSYVVDQRREAADALAASVGAQPADLAAVLGDGAVDGVIVASSTDSHLDIVLASLAAGKAVFCEKPLDLDLARLRAHAGELAAPKFPLYLAFNRRFDSEFRTLKAKLVAGAVGKLETLHLISHDPAPPPPAFIGPSGGLFRDFTIHDFDMANWLMDPAPSEVFAFAGCLFDAAIGAAGDVDTARLVLRNAAGQLAVISNTRRSGYGYDQRVEAYGSAGALMAGNLRASTVEQWSQAGARTAPILANFQTRYAEAYRVELDHFADILAGGTAPEAGYREGVAALALAEAAERSARSGRTERVEIL